MAKAALKPTAAPSSRPPPTPSQAGPFRRYAGPIGSVVLALAAYANSLGDGFAYDDDTIILNNPVVVEEYQGRPVPWYDVWRHPYWPETNARTGVDVLYRPFTVQTFAWDMRFLGPSAWWFHLVNVALHALVSLGAWWVALRLCRSDVAALVVGWLFAVHPIHTEAVTSIVGRAEVLATAGTIGAVFALDRLLGAERRAVAVAWGLASVAAAGAAIFSKESGAAVIPVAAVFGWWRLRGGRNAHHVGRAACLLAVMLLVFVGYLLIRYDVCGGRLRVTGQLYGEGNVLRDSQGLPRLLTPISLVGRYVGLMLWPSRLLGDYSYAVVVPTSSPLDLYFLLGLSVLGLLAVATVRSARRDGGVIVAGVGWFASYFFVSNSVVLIAVIMAERWFYGPSLWMTVLGAMSGQFALSRYVGRDRLNRLATSPLPVTLLAAATIALGIRTWTRNADWRDTATLLDHDLRAMSPSHRSAAFAWMLAVNRLEAGRLDEAERLAREAVAIYPESAKMHCTLAEVLLATSRPADAVKAAAEARRIAPNDARSAALLDQAQSALQGIDLQARLREAEEQIRRNPKGPAGYFAAGDVYERLGDYASAAEKYRRATELDADSRAAWLGLGRALAASNRADEAVAVYEEILRRWRGTDAWEAHANLALQLMDRARGKLYQPTRAIEHAERALEYGPADMRMQLTMNLAEVCAACGQPDRAVGLFEQVLRGLAPNDPQRRRLNERIEFLRKGG